MQSTKQNAESILMKEAIGFSTIIALAWLTELLHVPHWFFKEPPEFNWTRVLLRTGVVLATWVWVHFTTRRLLKRLPRPRAPVLRLALANLTRPGAAPCRATPLCSGRAGRPRRRG